MGVVGVDWLTRVAAARGDRTSGYIPLVVVAALALAACGQAAWYSLTLVQGQQGLSLSGQVVLNALPPCLLALATTLPLRFLRPLAAAVAVSAASVVMLAGFQRATVAGVIAVLLAAFRLGLTGGKQGAGRGRAEYAAVGLGASFLVLALAMPDVPEVLLAVGVPMAAATGIAIRAGRSASLESATRSVLAATLTEHMARGERARIARELHDVVAHHISMIAVQAETARLTTPGLPPAGAERLREIGDTARAGLAEMRRLLGVLREDVDPGDVGERYPQPGLPQVAALVDAAREATGGTVAGLIVSGAVASFDPGGELAAYRIVQEALTNARRHAPGAAVDVELRYDDDRLRLRIRDNGPGPSPPAARGAEQAAGHGLPGMRERAAFVGGTLDVGAAPGGGFLVEAVLPVQPDGVIA